MHKLLFAIRNRPVRSIAVLAVVGISLGVAVAAVACCVAPDLSSEMRERIHGTLADIVIDASNTDDSLDQERQMRIIEEVAREYVEAAIESQDLSSGSSTADDDTDGIDRWVRSEKHRQIMYRLGID